ncbi:type II secretion system protein [archaeon]|nr:type II secretion system protein [archaeon]
MKIKKTLGFTLIETIIVVAITGVIAATVSLFIVAPIRSYNDTTTRAELADEAYLVVKKLKQDVKRSLPNSLRTSTVGNKIFIEMMTISNGGKYRGQNNSTNSGDILDFTLGDTSFDLLSSPLTFKGGEKIVIANVGSVNYDSYAGNNLATYNGVLNSPVSNISVNAKKFPLESISENFYVVDQVVSYVCDKGSKTMTKYWGYTISSSQPTDTLANPLLSGSSALVAKNLKDCSFIYDQGGNSRNGILTIMIKLENSGQEATLYGESYVPNT